MEKVLYLEKEKSITFTGHRIIPFIRQEEVRTQLTTVVALAYKSGITCFYCGMALGFDLMAAEVVLSLKDKFSDIQLIAVVPFQDRVPDGLLLNRNGITEYFPKRIRLLH